MQWQCPPATLYGKIDSTTRQCRFTMSSSFCGLPATWCTGRLVPVIKIPHRTDDLGLFARRSTRSVRQHYAAMDTLQDVTDRLKEVIWVGEWKQI